MKKLWILSTPNLWMTNSDVLIKTLPKHWISEWWCLCFETFILKQKNEIWMLVSLLWKEFYQMLFLFLFSYQSSKELRKLLDCSLREGAPLPAAGRIDTQPEDAEKERLSQRAGNLRVHESLAQRFGFREADKMSCSSISSTVMFVLAVPKHIFFPI